MEARLAILMPVILGNLVDLVVVVQVPVIVPITVGLVQRAKDFLVELLLILVLTVEVGVGEQETPV